MIVLFNIFPKQKNKLDLTSTFTPIFSLDFLTHSLKSSTTAHTHTLTHIQYVRTGKNEREKEGKKEGRKEGNKEIRKERREWTFLKLFSVI